MARQYPYNFIGANGDNITSAQFVLNNGYYNSFSTTTPYDVPVTSRDDVSSTVFRQAYEAARIGIMEEVAANETLQALFDKPEWTIEDRAQYEEILSDITSRNIADQDLFSYKPSTAGNYLDNLDAASPDREFDCSQLSIITACLMQEAENDLAANGQLNGSDNSLKSVNDYYIMGGQIQFSGDDTPGGHAYLVSSATGAIIEGTATSDSYTPVATPGTNAFLDIVSGRPATTVSGDIYYPRLPDELVDMTVEDLVAQRRSSVAQNPMRPLTSDDSIRRNDVASRLPLSHYVGVYPLDIGSHFDGPAVEQQITELQTFLHTLDPEGFPESEIDGKFGRGTRDAVVAFQRANNIHPANGIANEETVDAIIEAAGRDRTSSVTVEEPVVAASGLSMFDEVEPTSPAPVEIVDATPQPQVQQVLAAHDALVVVDPATVEINIQTLNQYRFVIGVDGTAPTTDNPLQSAGTTELNTSQIEGGSTTFAGNYNNVSRDDNANTERLSWMALDGIVEDNALHNALASSQSMREALEEVMDINKDGLITVAEFAATKQALGELSPEHFASAEKLQEAISRDSGAAIA